MFFSLTNRCRAIKAEQRPNAAEIVEELQEIRDQVVSFNLSNQLTVEKPQDNGFRRNIISM